jgi:hypothetical protein
MGRSTVLARQLELTIWYLEEVPVPALSGRLLCQSAIASVHPARPGINLIKLFSIATVVVSQNKLQPML